MVARIAITIALIVTLGGVARADNVSQLADQLANDDSDRVRLAAAVSLA